LNHSWPAESLIEQHSMSLALEYILRVVIAAPQLSRKENAFPWNTALLHASADLSFDVVDTSSVDQPHTESKSSTDGLLLSIGILKGTETYGGDPGSSIQRK
jgi:hypothetical protein